MSEIINLEDNGMFENILSMIYSAKQKAEYQVNTTIIELYWQIGSYVSERVTKDGWGKSTVKELSAYILSKEPGIRGPIICILFLKRNPMKKKNFILISSKRKI